MCKTGFVQFNDNNICILEQYMIDEFVKAALNNPFKKFRYCLHHNIEDTLHEMVIVTTSQDLKYPDKHIDTSESNIILRGSLLVVLFEDDGSIKDAFILEPNSRFYYRCESNQFHMTIPLSDVAVYVEIKEGPFNDYSNTFPKWVPSKTDRDALYVFNKKIKDEAINLVMTKLQE